jgi:GTPase KRas protein
VLDTAGMEEYQIMQEQWIRESQGFILVYSVTNQDSFNEVRQIIKRIERITKTKTSPIVIVGNKKDLANQRVISTEDGQALATEFGVAFQETSALTGDGISQLYDSIIRQIRKKLGITKQDASKQESFFDKYCSLI